jgi:hypothetical protein
MRKEVLSMLHDDISKLLGHTVTEEEAVEFLCDLNDWLDNYSSKEEKDE